MQRVLGTIPCDFTRYWIMKFPNLLPHSYHAMESCSKENLFKRYYSPQYVFNKPDYFYDDSYDNIELQELYENARLFYNKSPKKENRQPNTNNSSNNNTYNKAEKSKRGSYNFNNKNQATNSSFITRDDMLKVDEKKFVWTLPK